MDPHYLSAAEAAAALGVSKATLYAYTSRGQLRSEAVPGTPRERRYLREDVERLQERKEVRRDPGRAAVRGLHWGSPVLDSGITLIRDGRLYYRGRDAVELAEHATLEEAAELLWSAAETLRFPAAARVTLPAGKSSPLARFQATLPLAGATDLAAYDLRAEGIRMTGARILRLFVEVVTGKRSDLPAHRALQAAWAPNRREAAEFIRTALVLCADHELNASTFVARCIASAGASPYDVVAGALAALKGFRHGGATERLQALFAEVEGGRRARTAIADRLRRGESIQGFGHPLYPAGDPRAALLLKMAGSSRLLRSIAKAGAELLQAVPNLDFGLVAASRAHGLPAYAPLVLFAMGRTVGWIAHAMEQYATGELIRPRARYVGPAPVK